MKCARDALLLYAVTDRTWLCGRTLKEQVEACLLGGATMIQLREKELDYPSFLSEAIELNALCGEYGVPFIINDNIDVAAACNATGVHVGQDDTDVKAARDRLGSGKLIGVSVQTVEQAVLAEQSGADYLGVGAVFPTASKADADDVQLKTLKKICDAVSIPVVAIGGINRHNILELKGTGIDGVAVISAIFADKDITGATKMLCALSKETVSG